jgi:hypothetical protein
MTKEFIPYTEALVLKELGFDEPCILLYRGLDAQPVCQMGYEFKTEKNSDYNDETNYWSTVPTFSQAFRWFREKYVLLGFIEPANGYEDKSLFAFYICDDEQNIVDDSHSYSKDSSLHFKTYEEAELACLKKLIEITSKL